MKKSQTLILIAFIAAAIIAVIAVAALPGNEPANQDDAAFLENYGLSDLTIEEIVLKLDSSTSDPAGLGASITSSYLVLMDDSNEVQLPLPEDRFYLSFAPYITQTHPCGTHSLTGCRGELVNQRVDVVITDSNGNEIVNSELTTMENGFVGVWLPKDIEATITVSYEGLVAQAPISTFDGSDTCLTTPLQLN